MVWPDARFPAVLVIAAEAWRWLFMKYGVCYGLTVRGSPEIWVNPRERCYTLEVPTYDIRFWRLDRYTFATVLSMVEIKSVAHLLVTSVELPVVPIIDMMSVSNCSVPRY